MSSDDFKIRRSGRGRMPPSFFLSSRLLTGLKLALYDSEFSSPTLLGHIEDSK